jgi:hypothetical protein
LFLSVFVALVMCQPQCAFFGYKYFEKDLDVL